MESNWAADHLQTIRTLMERSALYRRALAPIMLSAGIIGLGAAIIPWFVDLRTNRAFALYWMAVAVIASVTAFVLVRRQALREQEPVWSPPTKRVTEALEPGFIAGSAVGLLMVVFDNKLGAAAWHATAAWVILYGCALSAAGFFTPRGLKLFGRTFVFMGSGLLLISLAAPGDTQQMAHVVMGVMFGGLHLAYGIYLYFTERQRNA